MHKPNEYPTKDFYHATILRALGYKILRVERSKGHISTFVLDIGKDAAKTIIDMYWARELPVDSRTLVESINEVKTRLYAV